MEHKALPITGTPCMNTPELHAQWIWCNGGARPKNFYLYVRKSFQFSSGIRHVSVRVTADSRYHLFVNGVHVARGPARCDRRWQCLDQWNVTEWIRSGRNVIAALVHHYGEWTFSYMLGRGGFLADVQVDTAEGRTLRLGTDESWRVRPAQAWERSLPRMSIQLGYPEIFDARKDIQGWNEAAYDDSEWEPATVLGPAGMDPWPHLVPREIPAMTELPLRPERVIDTGEIGSATTGHYVDLLRVVWSTSNAVAYLATFVWSPGKMDAEIHAGSQEAIRLWVNGEQLISHLVTRDPAPDQEIVPVRLHPGWNSVLAKIVQGEGQWHFYFRIEGDGSERLVYSNSREKSPDEADGVSPWWMVGPFESAGLQQGFETRYPPEEDLDMDRSYRGKEGYEIRWISAGVTRESMLTSVVMSREPRFPREGRAVRNLEGLIAPGEPAIVHPGAEHGSYAVVDFGKEIAGYPVIEIDRALGGEIIDMGYSEVLQSPEGEILGPASEKIGIVNPDRAGVHYADRYVCKPGKQRFQTFDKRAFRYLQLDVRNVQQPLAVGPVSAIFSTYPVEYRGSFACSDTVLNRIWDVGRWTVQLNMEDAYTDCPWRERGQWWGDARVQALVNYYAFGDLLLVKQGLRHIAQSQSDEGLTMGVYPTDWSYGILPTFTLLWVISLWDYYEYSGDSALVNELFPAAERAMSSFQRFRSDHGLLRNVPHWLFVDWADVKTTGESASINALYHGALCAAAELADALKRHASHLQYKALAEGIRSGMHRHLWDGTRNCFRETWTDSGTSEKISEQANCWAITFGVAEGDMAGRIVEALFEEHQATVRTGTPYFAFYLLSALARTGQHGRMLEYVRTQWKKMLDWGATTWWEVWEPKASFCHGWSSGPTCILQAEILGVKPGKPGWEEIIVAPHPSGLAWARGIVPTPHGPISVDWRMENEFTMLIDTPRAARVSMPMMNQGVMSVTTGDDNLPANAERLPELEHHVAFILREPGRYRFHSR